MLRNETTQDDQVSSLIAEVADLKQKEKFSKYIQSLYFPFYKNFEEFGDLTFDFPLTVLVGKNGSGKSSILHALYGCPRGKSTGHFWFSTATDPIEDGNGEDMPQCFVYTFKDNNELKQTVMKRSPRPGTKTKRKDPDYWETDKPYAKYKMTVKKRCAPIELKSMYVDFRQELSAFDKFFYFEDISLLKTKTKQDFVRLVSPKLKTALSDKKRKYMVKGKVQNESFIDLTSKELHFISEILGVKYLEGKIIKHHFFRNWGVSALVRKNDFSYTEAHAGSGEFAVINLVHRLSMLEKNDSNLILLDEPETSLYPGAQKRLLIYLLKIIKRTKSQVVIATHSEKFISNLPNEAVKEIHFNAKTGKTHIQNSCSPTTVFSELEVPIRDNCTICVEDKAACILLNEVINESPLRDKVKVHHLSMGADSLKKQAILSSSQRSDWNDYYVLDGDQRIDVGNIEMLSSSKLNDLKYINSLVDKISGKISFPSSKNRKEKIDSPDESDPIKLHAEQNYLQFYYNNVSFLPKNTPEDIIWDEKYLTDLIKCDGLNVKLDRSNKKDTLVKIVQESIGAESISPEDYYSQFKRFTHHWVKQAKETSAYTSLYSIIEKFNQKFENKYR